MPRDEDGLARGRPFEIDREMIGRVRGGLAFVRSQKCHIEAPARKLEIVGIAAECGDVVLRREYEAHIIVALVLVEEVLPSVVEIDRFAFERPGARVGAAPALAGLL